MGVADLHADARRRRSSAQAGGGYVVHTPRGAIKARRVINATGAWSPELAELLGVDVPT